jgi:hypothetical protein
MNRPSEKLSAAEFESIIKPLPARERNLIRQQDLSPEWLRESIARSRKAMKRDLWVGPAWLILYTAALFTTGYGTFTITVFVLGTTYFLYTIFTSGSFGANRKKVTIYQRLLEKLEENGNKKE